MGFFDKIFGHKKAQTNTAKKTPVEPIQAAAPKNENVIKLLHLKNFIDSLMAAERYIVNNPG